MKNERQAESATNKLKVSLAEFLDCDTESVQAEWQKLNAKEKIRLFRDLLTLGPSVLWATELIWNEKGEDTGTLTEEQVDEIVRRMQEDRKAS